MSFEGRKPIGWVVIPFWFSLRDVATEGFRKAGSILRNILSTEGSQVVEEDLLMVR